MPVDQEGVDKYYTLKDQAGALKHFTVDEDFFSYKDFYEYKKVNTKKVIIPKNFKD